jgi:hypothetical protein
MPSLVELHSVVSETEGVKQQAEGHNVRYALELCNMCEDLIRIP